MNTVQFGLWMRLLAVVALPLVVLGWGHQQLRAGVVSAETPAVIINEWSQGQGGSQEWVELLVVTPQSLVGWQLGDATAGDLTFANAELWQQVAAGTRILIFNGSDPDPLLPAPDTNADDCRLIVAHSSAELFSGGWPALSNSNPADNPQLADASGAVVHDTSQQPGGMHPGAGQAVAFVGDGVGALASAEQWQSISAENATPADGNSPTNAAWLDALCSGAPPPDLADLTLAKSGPPRAEPNSTIVFELTLQNVGTQAATGVVLRDVLPAGMAYLSDDSGVAVQQPQPNELVWQLGTLSAGQSFAIRVNVQIMANAAGNLVNSAEATTTASESSTANNGAEATVQVGGAAILIDSVLPNGYENSDADEAVALINVGDSAVALEGWQLGDGSTARATLPAGMQLSPGERLWLANDATAFARQFGFAPDWQADRWPGFANAGDEVELWDADGQLVDKLVYGSGSTGGEGWQNSAVMPYVVRGVFGSEGQLLYRKRDQHTGLPVADTDRANDWAQDSAEGIGGRKVQYPGWDLDRFFFTEQVTETASLTVGIAPDNAFDLVVDQINSAQTTLHGEVLTMENIAIADAFTAAAERGVEVILLLEGGPSGGLPDAEKYACARIEAAGGACWFVISDAAQDIYDRYRFMHAKFLLVDGQRVLISSENFSPNSMPNDEKSDGTTGRRGVVLLTDAPGVVAHVQTIFDADFDPDAHVDIRRWQASDPVYGNPPPGFVPIRETGGISYTVRYPAPLTFRDQFAFEMVQSPENSLRDVDSLIGLVNRAGAGDRVLVQQLQERPYWGTSDSNPQVDPNPRLEAYLNAARRGASVDIMLDAYFDSPTSPVGNWATCEYVRRISAEEQLSLRCNLSNPTGLGIHNKMVLVEVNGKGYVHVGSLNGTEQSSKGNRELALQVQSDEAFRLLVDVFTRDLMYVVHLPGIFNRPRPAVEHVLISEVVYDSPGQDTAEFVELVNPSAHPIDISGYGLADAINPGDFEDLRRFPPGTVLQPKQVVVVATTAAGFLEQHGTLPDFELVETDSAVANLIDDREWGDPAALFQLGNSGDEVILRSPSDQMIDAIAYGTGEILGQRSCALVSAGSRSLERSPYWDDTNDCPNDFREWPFPSPGFLP